MNFNTLEDLIKSYIILGKKSPKGYEIVKCVVCNDYKMRGGFKFENESIHYNCFNCHASFKYNPKFKLNEDFKSALINFGIPEKILDEFILKNNFNRLSLENISNTNNTVLDKKIKKIPLMEVNLPPNSKKLLECDSIWKEVGIEYLKSRKLNPREYTYYISSHKDYLARLIIPYYFRNKLIYWQARALDDSLKERYKNIQGEKDNIFFNFDEIYRYTNDPLFVTEGCLDALSIGTQAVATLGSSLSDFQENELIKASKHRKIIFIIDKDENSKIKNGAKLAKKILNKNIDNWYITCFPDNIEDSNDALCKLGKLWLNYYLITSCVNGIEAQMLIKLKCE